MLVVGCVMQYIMHCCYLRFGGFFNSISLGLPRLFRACVLASRCLGWNGIRCIDWLPTCIGLAKIGQRLQISTIVLLQHRELVHRGQVKIGGPEQAPGPHPFHTPVPYPCSIPPWRIRSIPLFHTSDPYVIIYIIIYNYYLYIYTYNYIYIYWLCAIWFYICTHIYERTYIHACIHARICLLCPSPVIVLASLCLQHLQLLPTLLCDGRDVLGCCQLAV